MRGDFGGGGGFAKSRDVSVAGISLTPSLSHWERVAGGRVRVTTPEVIGARDFLQVGVGELAVDAVDEGAEFAGVNEQRLLPSVKTLHKAFNLHGIFNQRDQVYVITHNHECDDSDGVVVVGHG